MPLKTARSEEGVWGRYPQAGFRAAALTYPMREAPISKNLSGAGGGKSQGARARLCEIAAPEATIEIPVKMERISAMIAEILLLLVRIVIVAFGSAPIPVYLRFALGERWGFHPQTPAWGHRPQTPIPLRAYQRDIPIEKSLPFRKGFFTYFTRWQATQ